MPSKAPIRLPIRMPLGHGEPVDVGTVDITHPELLRVLFLNEKAQESLAEAITAIADTVYTEPIAGRDFDNGGHADRCRCRWCDPCVCGAPIAHTMYGYRHWPVRGEFPPDCDNPRPRSTQTQETPR